MTTAEWLYKLPLFLELGKNIWAYYFMHEIIFNQSINQNQPLTDELNQLMASYLVRCRFCCLRKC